jgi:translation elongation factor EF-4
VVTHVCVFNGELEPGFRSSCCIPKVSRRKRWAVNPKPHARLETGETVYITANIKSPEDVKMGDTITDSRVLCLAVFKSINGVRDPINTPTTNI